jgi:hypothetical protein
MCCSLLKQLLKGHGNEQNFSMFSHNSGQHRSLALPFEMFRFWLPIRGDSRNRKSTPQLSDSESRRESAIEFLKNAPHIGESSTPHIDDTVSRRLPVWVSWRVGESTTPRISDSWSRYVIKFYNMKKIPFDLYVCLLLQVSLVPAVVGLLCCWCAVVCIPALLC